MKKLSKDDVLAINRFQWLLDEINTLESGEALSFTREEWKERGGNQSPSQYAVPVHINKPKKLVKCRLRENNYLLIKI